MKYFLKKKFGFKDDEILLLVETHPDPIMRPTKENILNVGADGILLS